MRNYNAKIDHQEQHTKGNNANDELPAHNTKNDCSYNDDNTKNYNAKNDDTVHDDTRNGDTNDEITCSLKKKYFSMYVCTVRNKKKPWLSPWSLFTVYISRDQGVQS